MREPLGRTASLTEIIVCERDRGVRTRGKRESEERKRGAPLKKRLSSIEVQGNSMETDV